MAVLPTGITLERYGRRSYHVMIDGNHWGNVCGDMDRRQAKWTAVWFLRPAKLDVPDIAGKRRWFRTRAEAIAEIRINTSPDR